MIKRRLQQLQPLFVLLGFVLVALLLRSQWSELRSQPWRLHGGWLSLSAVLMLTSWAVEISLWQGLVQIMGARLGFVSAARIWFLSALVRYIPGNIWQPLSMTLYCQRWGIPAEATITSLLLYQVVTLLAVAPIAAVYFLLTGNWGLLSALLAGATPWLVTLALLPVIVFVARPGWLLDVINWGLHKAGRSKLAATLSTGQLVRSMGVGVGTWLLWGATFATLLYALQPFAIADLVRLTPHLVAVYAVGYAIGLLSLITPSGIGVREGALYLLLTPLLDGGLVTVVALAMRVWAMLGEAVLATLSALTDRTALRPAPAAQPVYPAASEVDATP
jgi:hypothetical protein